jgi:hypothetical protein
MGVADAWKKVSWYSRLRVCGGGGTSGRVSGVNIA